MSVHWIWWIAATLLIGAELITGTFYLLAIGIAVALGGVVAWLGASIEAQFAVAGVLGVALTAIESPGGIQAVNLKVAEQYVAAFSNIAKTNNTVIVPANLADLTGLVTSAMTVFKAQPR